MSRSKDRRDSPHACSNITGAAEAWDRPTREAASRRSTAQPNSPVSHIVEQIVSHLLLLISTHKHSQWPCSANPPSLAWASRVQFPHIDPADPAPSPVSRLGGTVRRSPAPPPTGRRGPATQCRDAKVMMSMLGRRRPLVSSECEDREHYYCAYYHSSHDPQAGNNLNCACVCHR